MRKQKVYYRYFRYTGNVLRAKREVPFEIRFTSRLVLDEICFFWNKTYIQSRLNDAIDQKNVDEFMRLSELYRQYIWE
ncbi:hypothetical protein [Oceanobacillus halotolerans]|uniref:hypothetical protein n=1 Tax=Oceanobacillus halotolerans TaxID=2663380 RepID=UPI0013DB282E|nr:hypothetical protein [Oceanobacillus halotolerans]